MPARHRHSNCRNDAAATIGSPWPGLVAAGPLADAIRPHSREDVVRVPQALRLNWMPYTSVCRVLAMGWRDKKIKKC